MATFPSLIPSEAPISPGAWPTTAHKSLNGAESRIRHGSAPIGGRWSPVFANITEGDFLAILSHYRGQRSGFDSFGFSTTTLAADRTPAGFAWLYVGSPRIVDQHGDCFTVQCEFRCEPRSNQATSSRALRTGATTLTVGARSGGVSFAVSRSLETYQTTLKVGARVAEPWPLAQASISHTTAILTQDATEDFTLNTGKLSQLLSVQISEPSWVRIYRSSAHRSADVRVAPGGLLQSMIDLGDAKPYSENLTTSALQTITQNPVATLQGDSNGLVYVRLIKKSAGSAAVTFTPTILLLNP